MWYSVFTPSVDGILKSVYKTLEKLDAVCSCQTERAKQLQAAADHSKSEADRATKIAANIRNFLK